MIATKDGPVYWLMKTSVGHVDGLAQDCGNSTSDAVELPQSCAKPSKGTQICIQIQNMFIINHRM